MQGTDKLNTITIIVFVLTDVLETNLLEMQQQYKKEGFEMFDEMIERIQRTTISVLLKVKLEIRAPQPAAPAAPATPAKPALIGCQSLT